MAMDLIPTPYLPTHTCCMPMWLAAVQLFIRLSSHLLGLPLPCRAPLRGNLGPRMGEPESGLCPSFFFLLPFCLYFPQPHLLSLTPYSPLLPSPFSLPSAALHLSFPSSLRSIISYSVLTDPPSVQKGRGWRIKLKCYQTSKPVLFNSMLSLSPFFSPQFLPKAKY